MVWLSAQPPVRPGSKPAWPVQWMLDENRTDSQTGVYPVLTTNTIGTFYVVKVEGNKRADLAARNRAEKGGKQAERWSSLAYVKENLAQARSRKLTKWHETKIQEREVSRRGFYIDTWNCSEKIVLPAQRRIRSSGDIPGQNRGDRNS